ncbi:MAG: hypothetical protein JO111_09265 [Caulobacteraceae bacterium]|nr:hypothetical protein [Caulobacteraceae bacterium]
MSPAKLMKLVSQTAPIVALSAAAVGAPSIAQAYSSGPNHVAVSLYAYRDDPVVIFGKTFYTSVTIVIDPLATNFTGFTLTLDYNPALYTFNQSASGPLGLISVGGDTPPPVAGSGTMPVLPLPSGFNPGSPLPGSTLTYTNSHGVLTVDYKLASPVSLTGDVDDFRLDFTTAPSALGEAIYAATGPGRDFSVASSTCFTSDMGGCGATTPATGITFVPEPAAWTLMIFGVFGIGAVLRRRPAAQTA